MSFPHEPQITPAQTTLAVAEGLRETKGRRGSQGPAAGKAERGPRGSTAWSMGSFWCFHCTYTHALSCTPAPEGWKT